MFVLDSMEYATDAAARAAWGTNRAKLYMEFAGSGNTFTDSSVEAHTLTAYGNATQSGGYGVFDGNGDYVKTDSHADFGIGTGDFTAEFIIKCPVSQNAVSHLMANGSWGSNRFGFCSNHSSVTANKVSFWLYNYNSGAAPMLVSTTSVNTNTDICICLEKYGNNYNLYVAGSKEATASYTGSMDGGGSQILYIGGNGSNEWFLGSVKKFRFTKSALYKGNNYTPPTEFGDFITSSSEGTIKQHGSYSLKLVALQTESLNRTAARTLSPTFNLSGQTSFKFDVGATRTGSQFKIGLHDSGGTMTEVTPNIATSCDSPEDMQEVTLDLSAVSDANKDAIDSIIFTVTNADVENTVYLDYMRTLSDGEGAGGGVSKSRIIGGV
jgi:hypothetical protein